MSLTKRPRVVSANAVVDAQLITAENNPRLLALILILGHVVHMPCVELKLRKAVAP